MAGRLESGVKRTLALSAAPWGGGFAFQFFDAFERACAQRIRITRDGGFSRAQDLRRATVEGGHQLLQLVKQLSAHRHRGAHWRLVCARATFQTSPHAVHRQ